MEKDLKIINVLRVFEGVINKKYINNTKAGRECDGFVYFTSGSIEYVFDGYSFTASSGSMIYLAKNSLYEMNLIEKASFICIDFMFEPSERPRTSELFKNIPISCKNDFEKALHTWYQRSPWYISDIFSITYRAYSLALMSSYKAYNRTGEIFSEISSFILKNYTSHRLSVADIATAAKLSEPHLRRIFKAHTNTSPINYIIFLRLEKAKNLLVYSNYSIAKISEACGFSDPYYFSRLFKKTVGISPSEYKIKNFSS